MVKEEARRRNHAKPLYIGIRHPTFKIPGYCEFGHSLSLGFVVCKDTCVSVLICVTCGQGIQEPVGELKLGPDGLTEHFSAPNELDLTLELIAEHARQERKVDIHGDPIRMAWFDAKQSIFQRKIKAQGEVWR